MKSRDFFDRELTVQKQQILIPRIIKTAYRETDTGKFYLDIDSEQKNTIPEIF